MSQAARRILINEEAEGLALRLAVALVGQRRRVLVSRMVAGPHEELLRLANTLAYSWLSVLDMAKQDLDVHLDLARKAQLHDHILLLPPQEIRSSPDVKVAVPMMDVRLSSDALWKDRGIQVLLALLDMAQSLECSTVCLRLQRQEKTGSST